MPHVGWHSDANSAAWVVHIYTITPLLPNTHGRDQPLKVWYWHNAWDVRHSCVLWRFIRKILYLSDTFKVIYRTFYHIDKSKIYFGGFKPTTFWVLNTNTCVDATCNIKLGSICSLFWPTCKETNNFLFCF